MAKIYGYRKEKDPKKRDKIWLILDRKQDTVKNFLTRHVGELSQGKGLSVSMSRE